MQRAYRTCRTVFSHFHLVGSVSVENFRKMNLGLMNNGVRRIVSSTAFISAVRGSNPSQQIFHLPVASQASLTRCSGSGLQTGSRWASCPHLHIQTCQYASIAHLDRSNVGWWGRIRNQLGLKEKLKIRKSVLNAAGYNMYVACQELVDFEMVFEELDFPDSFNSWFLITSLHVWICMVRLSQLGREGRVVRNSMTEAMWSDVDKRSKQLGDAVSLTARREGIKEMGYVFYAALFSYDEGLLGDDRVLAGAVWRVLFEMRDKEPEHLSQAVEYIRKQVQHLDTLNGELMLRKGLVSFLPFYGNIFDKEDVNRRLRKIYNKDMYT